jgi:hypothetical protein
MDHARRWHRVSLMVFSSLDYCLLCPGSLDRQAQRNDGFGYDPIILQTFAYPRQVI